MIQQWCYKFARSLSVGVVVCLMSFAAFSKERIISDFSLQIPRHFFEETIEKKWEALTVKEFRENWKSSEQMTVVNDNSFNLQDLTAATAISWRKPRYVNFEEGVFVESQKFSLEVHVAKLALDKEVEKNLGGLVGRFRLKAQCENITLKMNPLKGRLSFSLTPQLERADLNWFVRNLQLAWDSDAWEVSAFSCVGAEGFEDALAAEIKKALSNPEGFIEPQKEFLTAMIQKYFTPLSVNFLEGHATIKGRRDIVTLLQVNEKSVQRDGGLLLRGLLIVDFLMSPVKSEKVLSLQAGAELQEDQAQLRLPSKFFVEFLQAAYRRSSWRHHVSSTQVPGFSALQKSRWTQFFIWPELMKYPKSTEFFFDLFSDKDVVFRGVGLDIQVNANIITNMSAPHGSLQKPFMRFSVPFISSVKLRVEKGFLQVSLQGTSVRLRPFWAAEYLRNENPSTFFAASKISQKIESELTKKNYQWVLPEIQFGDGFSLRIMKVEVSRNKELVLFLQP